MGSMVDEIIEIISRLSLKNGYSSYQVFNDWIQVTALAIQNSSCIIHDELWQKREEQYFEVLKKYKQNLFPDLTGLLTIELEQNISDVLGYVYMAGSMGSKATGQFFTPFHLSYMTASLSFREEMLNEEVITLNEPSIGGGGMVIAFAKVLQEHGVNYQKKLRVIGQDLDWKGVYMSYVQLSLLGIDAVIAQGDTLSVPFGKGYPKDRILRSPRNMGVLL